MNKFFLKSKTVIGILTVAIVQLAPVLGFSFTEDDSAMVNSAVDAVVTALASLLALFGRFTAKQSISVVPGAGGGSSTLRTSAWATVLAVVLLFAIGGCSSVPSQNHAIVAATQTIAELARQTDRLQKNGVITNDKEDEILDRLANANSQLRLAESLMDSCPDPCSDVDNILITVDGLLTDIENELRNAP